MSRADRKQGIHKSFTRTSIYNYFESKEEIFLAIFEDEYIKWTKDGVLFNPYF